MNTSIGKRPVVLKRKDDRIIIHFDYDCFYASVFEAENPALRALPLAVQQKQIIVTCNYEARRRGLRKLQLITEAKQVCPDVVIVLGEQLDRFRNASKMLYKYLEAFTWNKKVERLGFDEVFMDVTDIVAYNLMLVNGNDLKHSFFQLDREDPTVGFEFDASSISGHEYPDSKDVGPTTLQHEDEELMVRLVLGSHLARHLRHKMEEDKGYTSTVGISTSKLLAKLVGNLHKPKGQTTLLPPYESYPPDLISNVTTFIDSHDIGKIPGIGFKMAHKIRCYLLARHAKFDAGLIYGGTFESVSVQDVRLHPDVNPDFLEKLLGGPGAERGIGLKVYALINGIDDTDVKEARKVPSQISIEDSYIRLDTILQVQKEVRMLATSLMRRMHLDLLEDDEEEGKKRWMAHPRTIRLSTRPRPPLNADGTRTRSFNRISRSAPTPNFIFDLKEGVDAIVERLATETLLPMFHRLHPESHGWNLSLMNIGVTNMAEAASNDGSGGGRDISRMFKRQEEVLKEWKVEDRDIPPEEPPTTVSKEEESAANAIPEDNHENSPIKIKDQTAVHKTEPSAGYEVLPPLTTVPSFEDSTHTEEQGSEEALFATQTEDEYSVAEWIEDEEEAGERCSICGAIMPAFAMPAHERFHGFEVESDVEV